ncbi:hypothetical protein ABBQ38_015346 [Trebouxia sp. C0009 RCD-2024]
MSVAARSPHHSNKRHFEQSSDSPDPFIPDRASSHINKRFRQYTPPSLRCNPLTERQSHVISSSTLQALKGLFPDMDDKTIGDVLDACGNNIDVAIKQLGQLRLTVHCGTAPTDTDSAVNQQNTTSTSSQAPGTSAPASTSVQSAVAAAEPKPKSPEEWVETLVQQMAGARDMADARSRAANVLHTFQQAVLDTSHVQGSTVSQDNLKTQLAELQHNNSILKRAVAIQNNRIQDLSSKEAESQPLKQLIAQLQEKCQGLELNNYSLAMHLRHATDSAQVQQGQRRPDVF